MSLPSLTVSGTLTADPEVRFLQNGDAVAGFTIAANSRKYNKQTDKWEDGDATFLKCSAWRQLAENAAETLRKGTRVVATGVLKQKSWEQEGQKRSSVELEVDDLGVSLKFAAKKSTASDPWG